jgi:tetratricopeptide (TPR) repeat protein
VLAAGIHLAAQDLWYKTYLDAKTAYDRHDLATAEQKFLASMSERGAPREHGPSVLLVSQQRGFMPEYYLALIYAERKQWVDVVRYATLAERYRDLTDHLRAPIVAAMATATKALEAPPPGGGGTVAGDTLFRNAQSAAAAERFDEARSLAAQALASGASPGSIDLLRQFIEDHEFDAVLRDGTKARDDGRYPAARAAITRLRALNVDANRKSAIDPLATSIDRRESYASAMADARRFFGDKRWADARTSADRASRLGVNDVEARALVTEATRQETFAGLVATARQAFDGNRLTDARTAISRARAMNIDSRDLDDLEARVGVRELSARVDALVSAGTVQGLAPLVERLTTTAPKDPVVAKAQAFMAAHLGDAEKERRGLTQFFHGQYEVAIVTLAQLDAKDRPRATLYLAYAEAAVSLVETDSTKRRQLADEARRTLDGVRTRVGRLSPEDTRFVSPGILALLGLTPAN